MTSDGIVMRRGPAGVRAALGPGGPDVWEVVAAVRAAGNHVGRAARYLDLENADVGRALDYHRRHPEEIEARLRSERDLARRAEAAWRQGRRG